MSHILIPEQEAQELAPDIESVLTYASSLQEVAQAYQELTLQSGNINRMRDDQVIPTPAQPLLDQAPLREGTFFVVPKIIKQQG